MSTPNFRVAHLLCEYAANPLGLDVREPRFCWRLIANQGAVRDLVQSAYHIQVATSAEGLDSGEGMVWDSGKVISDTSVHRAYAGEALQWRERYYWRVRVWDGADTASEWSEAAWWEMALNPNDWQAQWIAPTLEEDTSKPEPAALLRTEFSLRGDVVAARAYVSAAGLYQLEVNGTRFDEELFRPGWTTYHKRIQYQTIDVTDQLRAGENAIGVTLGDGWWRGSMGWKPGRNTYGSRLALLFQLHVRYADGSEDVIASQPDSWKCATGPILFSDIYHGESYDARLERPGWSKPGYDESDWLPVEAIAPEVGEIVPQYGPSVTRQEEMRAKTIHTAPNGEVLLDFGQNMVGWVRLRVSGEAGTVITLRFAEVLQPDGNLYVANLRSARATDTYTLKGGGEEVWEPRFTFHGFRHVGISGYPGEVTAESVVGIVLHSESAKTGDFASSNPLLNQLQSNIVWGQKGNFLEVPTDCPQRDERLGWTGDAQVFARTALYNRDVAAFYTRWLKDLALDQTHDGAVPVVVPDILFQGGAAAWGDAAGIVPWTIYLVNGDTRILEEQYQSMLAWVEFMRLQAGDDLIWHPGEFKQYGDWVAVEAQDEKFPNPVTSYAYLCTAFFVYSTELLVKAAQILGREEDALYYGTLLPRIKQAIAQEFITPAGRIDGNTQTDYVLALHFDLLPESQRADAAQRLAQEVANFDNHLSTGFVGTPYLCHVLSSAGYLDLAYEVVESETWPSWLYTVKMGATTMWERWDSIRPNGSFGNVSMNSFNHYAYGAIGDWLYQVVAGIDVDPASPGYKRAIIAPQPGGSLTWARAKHESLYGTVASAWQRGEGKFTLDVVIPPNTEGVVRLPAQAINQVSERGVALGEVEGVHTVRLEGDKVEVTVGSGHYTFVVNG